MEEDEEEEEALWARVSAFLSNDKSHIRWAPGHKYAMQGAW